MLKVGITGGIGSGKTTVCGIFEILGVPVFNADMQAKSIMVTDTSLITSIKKEFGEESYFSSGKLNKEYLANKVFNNREALKKLNSLVHPATIRAFNVWALQQKTAYVIKEAAILIESGSYQDCDFVIVVTSPEDIRIARVIDREGVNEKDVRSRMNKQMSEEEKVNIADFIIVNDDKTAIIPQVLKLHEYFVNISINPIGS
jgi:dephospho-CoA kinase